MFNKNYLGKIKSIKIIFFVFVALYLISCQKDTKDSFYEFSSDLNNQIIDLNFYKSGYYTITYERDMTEDQIIYELFSMGVYEFKGNMIITKDIINSFQMEFLISKDKLIPQKALKFLSSGTITRQKYGPMESFDYDGIQEDILDLLALDRERLSQILNSNGVHAGKYLSEHNVFYRRNLDEDGYSIKINEDNSFIYQFNDLPLLSGNWIQKGKLIQLKDDILSESFFLEIVNDTTLKSSFLPSNSDSLKYCLANSNNQFFEKQHNKKN